MVLQDFKNVSSIVIGPLSTSERRVALKGVLLLQRRQLLPTQCTICISKSDYETNVQYMQCFQKKVKRKKTLEIIKNSKVGSILLARPACC